MALCYGYCHKMKPCEFIGNCGLDIVNITCVGDTEEIYVIGACQPSEKCKRDNANFKPLSKKQFCELYHKIPIAKRTGKYKGLLSTYEQAKINGLVE